MKELFTYLPILLFLIIIYKLSNRELDRTLDITKASEEFLLKEKSKLEEQISAKSKKLKESRFQRMNELSRAAEFGRLNQGLFHVIYLFQDYLRILFYASMCLRFLRLACN